MSVVVIACAVDVAVLGLIQLAIFPIVAVILVAKDVITHERAHRASAVVA